MDVRTLTLRFDPDQDRPDYPVVTVLVDGRDLVEGSSRPNFLGFDPDTILGEGSPLLPVEPPRRVAVYRCSCGEPGCGCIAPVISREGEHVVWSDARDFTGVYARPTVARNPSGGSPVGLPELRFGAEQYEAEVRRASEDRSWENDRRATARLLGDHLKDEKRRLHSLGYRVHWVGPHWQIPDGFQVSLIDAESRQVVVELRAAEQRPSDRAAELAERLLASRPEDWEVSFRGEPLPWPEDTG